MTTIQNWTHQAAFYERVVRLELHGLHFQHIELCERRAWMYLHKINFAQWHERVATGTAKHETSYSRDYSTEGLFGLAPDRIDWDDGVVYENKGTAGAKEASNNQTAFYAVMLAIATGKEWHYLGWPRTGLIGMMVWCMRIRGRRGLKKLLITKRRFMR